MVTYAVAVIAKTGYWMKAVLSVTVITKHFLVSRPRFAKIGTAMVIHGMNG